MKKACIGSAIIVALVLILPDSSYGSAIFDKAVNYYQAEKYDSTIILIRNYLRKHGKDPESERLVPLITEALVRRGDYGSAHRLITMFKQKFTTSSFIPRLNYVEGVAYAREEKFLNALTSFSAAFEGGISQVLDSLTLQNTEKICNQMTPDEFAIASTRGIHPRIMEVVLYHQIVKLVSVGQFVKAQNFAEDFRKTYPRSKYEMSLRNLVSSAKEKQKGTLQIGILAPVSGEEAEIGKKIVQGAQLAIEQMGTQSGLTIKTIALDTKGSMVETAKRTRELMNEHMVPVIIGPVLSHTATVSAAALMGKQTVMVSPTATDDGIAALGKNIFQMNVTLGVLGRKIARYAIENLNIRDFAILAPSTPYGMIMAESFKEELRKKDVELVAEEYFEEGANDFKQQYLNIRSKLLFRHLEKLSMDRGQDFKGRVSRADSIKYADSTLSVGGLFIPADGEDVVMLAPQAYFHRVRTQLLGSNGWHNQRVVQDGKRYVANAIISSSFELDQSQKAWLNFKQAYKTRFNAEPDRIAALGYDAASIVLKSVQDAGDSPERIADALAKLQRFSGLSGMISFESDDRANNEVTILKVTENGFLRVQ